MNEMPRKILTGAQKSQNSFKGCQMPKDRQ